MIKYILYKRRNNMSGHSKWATIHRKKGLLDAARGKVFQKLAKELYVAAKSGDPDPANNAQLRMVVEKAKAEAEIAIAKAEGEAKAMRIKADAEAYYNMKISSSLTHNIVLEDWIEKWDGKLPQMQGNSNMVPMVNFNK